MYVCINIYVYADGLKYLKSIILTKKQYMYKKLKTRYYNLIEQNAEKNISKK